MNSGALLQQMRETLQAFWRMKAGVAMVRHLEIDEFDEIINYQNLPEIASAQPILVRESARTSFFEVSRYIETGQLSRDVFLRLINHLEEFYISKLSVRSLPTNGTLGSLQSRCEASYSVSGLLAQKITEIRERRNAFIHGNGTPSPNYINAAVNVYSYSNGIIKDPSIVIKLDTSDEYLAYCLREIHAYSALF
jgi:hypothetical protein